MIYKFSAIILAFFISFSGMAANSSLYSAKVNLKDEFGSNYEMKKLGGKKVIMTMAYTRCQIMCPMIIGKVKTMEDHYKKKNVPVEVVVITFDSRMDTPDKLHSYYRDERSIKGDNWHFLVGSESQTRMMSLLLGIKYSVNPKSKVITHDNKILVLDENGAVEKRYESLDEVAFND